MVSIANLPNPVDISPQLLKYNTPIKKIPEFWKVGENDYHYLPCSDDYSMVMIYSDLFEILGVLFDKDNLRNNVLSHIRKHQKYYDKVMQSYLHHKKLEFLNWLVGMTNNTIPADEICLHASGVYLNAHITVGYHLGVWTRLNIPNILHDLAVGLSEVHLAYGGSWTFSQL